MNVKYANPKSKEHWIAIAFVTVASILLTLEGSGVFSFNVGSLLVLGATCCWGLRHMACQPRAHYDNGSLKLNFQNFINVYLPTLGITPNQL